MSSTVIYMMIGVIFSFVSTSWASQYSCKVEGVREAVTVNDALFFWAILHAKNNFISYFQVISFYDRLCIRVLEQNKCYKIRSHLRAVWGEAS